MCERRDSIRAVRDAAEALLAACVSVPQSFRQIVNGTAVEPVPADFTSLLGDIDRNDRPRARPATKAGGRRAPH